MFTHKLTNDAELRLLEPRHAEELYLLVDSNREHLRRWLPWVDSTKSTEDIVAFIKQQLQRLATNGTTVASIWYENNLAGIISLNSSSVRCMEIGYWLGEKYQGKGLMTAACKAMIGHSFVELDINRIEIRVEPDNDRSKAIPGRLGFTYEGTQRQKGMNADGKAVDLMMFSLLKEEWEAQSHVY
jgi:ribosomal-protein-serine acetyltransferase